jgi:hypothetical protein
MRSGQPASRRRYEGEPPASYCGCGVLNLGKAHVAGSVGRMIGALPRAFMKKVFTLFLLAASSLGLTAPAFAKSKNTYTQPTNLHKSEKKQAKAQKKYAKRQKKAEKKMLKTSKKNTHYPPQAF